MFFRIVNSVSEQGLTPLHQAVSERNVDVIQKLIAMNADVSKTDLRGRNPFHFAATNKELIEARKMFALREF